MIKLIFFYAFVNLCGANNAPIIGILTQPASTISYDADTYIAGSYIKFLESAGARVLPIWINQSADYYQRVVNYTNGVLFPGGSAAFDTVGGYGEAAWKIYHIAKAANDHGSFFPLWGTCLGFEVLPFAEAGEDIRVNCSIPDGSYSLNFTNGYGNIYPRTLEGKIATIVYAIIGMPLFLLYLSNIGDIMARSFKWIYAKFCLCRCCPGVAKRRALRKIKREKRMQVDYVSEEEASGSSESMEVAVSIPPLGPRDSIVSEAFTEEFDTDVQNIPVPITVCLGIMVGYICSGALLFCKWEEHWSFMDASYFCFISLSTIGFGDLVPGDKIYGRGRDFYTGILELSFVFCSIYLMLGMALIAMCFNLMQEEVIHKIRTTIRTVKYILRCNR